MTMITKQISIFIENRQGRLAEICDIIAQNGINIRALSVADTTSFGILRLIVDDPERLESILRENHITASITSVISACIDDRPGGLVNLLRLLEDIQIEYMYTYISISGRGLYCPAGRPGQRGFRSSARSGVSRPEGSLND